MTRPDPIQLPETGFVPGMSHGTGGNTLEPKRPRLRRQHKSFMPAAPLTPGQLAAAGLATFFGTLGVALLVTGGHDPWGFLAGVGWGAVLVLAYRWAAAVDG